MNPIERALNQFKKDYSWDKNLLPDVEEELAPQNKTLSFTLPAHEKKTLELL